MLDVNQVTDEDTPGVLSRLKSSERQYGVRGVTNSPVWLGLGKVSIENSSSN